MTITSATIAEGRNIITSSDCKADMPLCTDEDQLTSEVPYVPAFAMNNMVRPDGSWIPWSCPECEYVITNPFDPCSNLNLKELNALINEGLLDMDEIDHPQWPERCTECKMLKRLSDRIKVWQKKFKQRFNPNKHKYIKLLTITLDMDNKRFSDDKEAYISQCREKLRYGFWQMRRTQTWKNCIDGGLWFFEYTTDGISTNCHMHAILLGKYLPQKKIVELTTHYNLGKVVWINADPKKTLDHSLGYIGHYAKKQYQMNGRNRNGFGSMLKPPPPGRGTAR